MLSKKGQVGVEYMVITIFALVLIMITFGYSQANLDHSLKINQANDLMDNLANNIRYIYVAGPGNTLVWKIDIPAGTRGITTTNMCKNGSMVEGDCTGPGQNGVDRTRIDLNIDVLLGNTKVEAESITAFEFTDDAEGKAFPCTPGHEFCQGKFVVMLCWNSTETNVCPACPSGTICLKKL